MINLTRRYRIDFGRCSGMLTPTHCRYKIGEQIQHAEQAVAAIGVVGPVFAVLTPSMLNGVFGVVAGAVALIAMTGIQKLRS